MKFYSNIAFDKVALQYRVTLYDHKGILREAVNFDDKNEALTYKQEIEEAYNVKTG